MQKKVLVVGATGTLGGHVVERLVEENVPVRAATRPPEAFRPGVEAVSFDFDRPSTFAPALAGIARAFLIALQA